MNGNTGAPKEEQNLAPPSLKTDRFRRRSQVRPKSQAAKQFNERLSVQDDTRLGNRPTRRDMQRMRSLSPGGDQARDDSASLHSAQSFLSFVPPTPKEYEYDLDETEDQDIEELWYGSRKRTEIQETLLIKV